MTNLSPDIRDAVQGEVVAGVEVLGQGDVGKVRRGSHVLVLLTSLHWTASADDIILELSPRKEFILIE